MHVSVGFDGSSAHLNPHQAYEDNANVNNASQNSLLGTSFVIIQLKEPRNNGFSWINPTPQSPRYCRLLYLQLKKETDEEIKAEYARLLKERNKLTTFRMKTSEGIINVTFVVSFTLFDGKSVNAITKNKSTNSCPICQKTCSQFGNLDADFRPVSDQNLELGLGLLHCLIKVLEYLLQLSYRTEIKKWICRGPLQGR